MFFVMKFLLKFLATALVAFFFSANAFGQESVPKPLKKLSKKELILIIEEQKSSNQALIGELTNGSERIRLLDSTILAQKAIIDSVITTKNEYSEIYNRYREMYLELLTKCDLNAKPAEKKNFPNIKTFSDAENIFHWTVDGSKQTVRLEIKDGKVTAICGISQNIRPGKGGTIEIRSNTDSKKIILSFPVGELGKQTKFPNTIKLLDLVRQRLDDKEYDWCLWPVISKKQ